MEKEIGHILVISSPLQGHAAPLMKLSHQITKGGSKVTFMATDLPPETTNRSWNERLRIISVPSGLRLEEGGWKDQEKSLERVRTVLHSYMEELLSEKEKSSTGRISGVIVDAPLGWMLEGLKKMGLKTAVYWCSNAGCLALGFKIPHLLESKFIDEDGTPLKNERIKLLPDLPEMSMEELIWHYPSDKDMQKSMFHAIKGIMHCMKEADWIVGNWFPQLEPSAANISANILPLGPLLAAVGEPSGSFHSEDSTCLSWLNNHPHNSVVYVAFGSTARFTRRQLDELAAALELLNRPFLWVAWAGLTGSWSGPTGSSTQPYSEEFAVRVAGRGKMVGWAPQEAVLAHPAIGCFLTHCGWNSFVEGLSRGVPVVCWPYFGDQMYTRRCACDGWGVGVGVEGGGDGVVGREEIRGRVEEVMGDGSLRENALRLRGMARESIQEGGESRVNLDYLLQQMKY